MQNHLEHCMNMSLCESHVFDYVNIYEDVCMAMYVLWWYPCNYDDGDEMRMMHKKLGDK